MGPAGVVLFLQVYLCTPRTQPTSVFETSTFTNKALSKPKQGSPFGSPQSSLPFPGWYPSNFQVPVLFLLPTRCFLRKTCYWKPNPPGFQPNKKKRTTPFFFETQTPWVSTFNQSTSPTKLLSFGWQKRKTPNLYHLKTLTWWRLSVGWLQLAS